MEAIEGTQITLEAVKDSIDLKTFGILAAVGKIELENIRERCQMGYRGRVSRGKVTGTAKFGYTIEAGLPVVVPGEAETVGRIFREYLEGRACEPIADSLNLDGVPTRNGGTWNGSRVWGILTSTTYIGEGQCCRVHYTKRDNGVRDVKHTKHMPEHNWVTVPYPRIIDDATWQKAREMRKHPQRKIWDRQRKHDVVYLLEGLLWCGHCGKRYRPGASYRILRWTTKDGVEHRRKSDTLRLRYMCNGGSKAGCPRPTMHVRSIEALVWETVANFILRPEQVKALLESQQTALESGETLENVVKARGHLAQVEAERGRALLQHQRGYIDDGELDIRMKGTNERIEYFQDELARLEAEATQATKALEILQGWLCEAHHIAARLENLTNVERAEVVRLLVDRVTVSGRETQIRMVLDSKGYVSSQPHRWPA
jgi:site-specific DNA recombinase